MSDTKFSIAKVAQIIDVSTTTLKRWYKWYEDADYEKPIELKLPEYTTDNRGTKFFKFSDIVKLKQFKEDLQGKYYGVMADFNANYQWGQRGTKILNKKLKKEEK